MTIDRDSHRTQRKGGTPRDRIENGVSVRGLIKSFRRRGGEIVHAIDDIDLDVKQGELLVLLGPSGCGKTTLMRCIAGLETPDSGRISIGDSPVFDTARKLDLSANKRPAGMVFQSYALWPHMSVFGNVSYPLKNQRIRGAELKRRVDEVLAVAGISELRDQYPAQLSGGQQQRVALARAIVAGDEVILFDEPLSNVDAKVRDTLRLELLQMQSRLGFTALYVTHDQDEAMTLGTRIAVLQTGKVAQLGTPREVYSTPQTHYVANFMGAANEVPGQIARTEGEYVTVTTQIGELRGHAPQPIAGTATRALIRPENVMISASSHEAGENRVSGIVEGCVFRGGGRLEYIIDCSSVLLRVWTQDSSGGIATGTEVTVSFDPSDVLVFGGPS